NSFFIIVNYFVINDSTVISSCCSTPSKSISVGAKSASLPSLLTSTPSLVTITGTGFVVCVVIGDSVSVNTSSELPWSAVIIAVPFIDNILSTTSPRHSSTASIALIVGSSIPL